MKASTIIPLLLFMFVIVMSVNLPQRACAAVVWSDDFNDGNYDGWSVCRGSYSASSGYMVGTTTSWNWAYRESAMTVGTWSFDIYFGVVDDGIAVWFMCETIDPAQYDHPLTGYFVFYASAAPGSVHLELAYDSTFNPIEDVSVSDTTTGWKHIDVVRHSDGQILVYLGGNLMIDALDSRYSSPSYFYLQGFNVHGIDNIVVDDEVTEPTTTTSTTTTTGTTTTTTTGTTTTTTTSTGSSPDILGDLPVVLAIGSIATFIIITGLVLVSRGKHRGFSSGVQGPSPPSRPTPPSTGAIPADSKELVLGALKSYPRVSMRELSKLLSLPEDEVRRLTLKLIAAGAVSGAFDRSMDEFVSVSATKTGRELETGTSKPQALPSCPFCGAPLTRPLGAGESTKCDNCGKMLKG